MADGRSARRERDIKHLSGFGFDFITFNVLKINKFYFYYYHPVIIMQVEHMNVIRVVDFYATKHTYQSRLCFSGFLSSVCCFLFSVVWRALCRICFWHYVTLCAVAIASADTECTDGPASDNIGHGIIARRYQYRYHYRRRDSTPTEQRAGCDKILPKQLTINRTNNKNCSIKEQLRALSPQAGRRRTNTNVLHLLLHLLLSGLGLLCFRRDIAPVTGTQRPEYIRRDENHTFSGNQTTNQKRPRTSRMRQNNGHKQKPTKNTLFAKHKQKHKTKVEGKVFKYFLKNFQMAL